MNYEVLENYRGHKKGDIITLRDIPDNDLEKVTTKKIVKKVDENAIENKAIKQPKNTKGV